jgi:putative component of membrane protein insertase Oxa1/YidC/SpoIIIJ protein YidD
MRTILVKLILSFTLTFTCSLHAQKDWQKWNKLDVSYEIQQTPDSSPRFSTAGVGSFLLSSFQVGYTYLFSNYDGANCPFHPTCSAFFVQSVKQTNILKGALMFADRFTRDTNIFKRFPHYPYYKTGRLYDPVHNYKLYLSEIKYYSRDTVVE